MKTTNIVIDEKATPAVPIPDHTGFSVLSLGAGVQSSALALMYAKGIFTPMPDVAIFADTQAEPPGVYKWLDYLKEKLPYPVKRVTKGDLTELSMQTHVSKAGNVYQRNQIPAFVKGDGDRRGIIPRHCTTEFKIDPIYRYTKSIVNKGQRVIMIMGISWDETQRMKDSRRAWVENRYPLVEQRITREMCKLWMVQNEYPEPPRSACVFCPYHSNKEWRRLQTEEPEEFSKAVDYEKRLQKLYIKITNIDGTPYLHNSCKPLESIDFDEVGGQDDLFGGECEGMCGV